MHIFFSFKPNTVYNVKQKDGKQVMYIHTYIHVHIYNIHNNNDDDKNNNNKNNNNKIHNGRLGHSSRCHSLALFIFAQLNVIRFYVIRYNNYYTLN